MQLLEHFKELTIHPKNAEELKGLILQLAIQGKLTKKWREQNPDVKPASVLLEKIVAEKAQLIKEKKIKKEKPLEKVTDEDFTGVIPSSWVITRLGEIGDWGAGATPSRSRSDFYGGEINWFKSGELNNGIMDYNSKESINELAIQNSSLRLNKVGDVLIAMYGATIGKTGLLAKDGATNQAVCACTPFSCISNVYLHLLLKALKDVFVNQGEGGAQPNISRVKLRTQVFALPPLEEQKAIVSIVNQLFKEVEELEQQTKTRIKLKEDFVTSALQQLAEGDTSAEWAFLQPHFRTFFTEKSAVKKLRETILQLAVQGKLTTRWREQNSDVEPAKVLLERIKAEKAQLVKEKKIKKEKPLPEITAEEIPYDLPEGWEWCRLGEVCEYIQRGKSPKYSEVPKIPVVSQKCVQWSGFDISRARFISEESLEKYGPERYLQDGDLLWNSTGDGTVGRVILFPGSDFDKVVADSHVTVVRGVKKHLRSDYLWIFTASPLIQNLVSGRVSGSTKQTELGTGTVKNMEFSFPPLEEQKAIVTKVNSLMALCDSLEKEIDEKTHHLEQLMQSCLREVFEID